MLGLAYSSFCSILFYFFSSLLIIIIFDAIERAGDVSLVAQLRRKDLKLRAGVGRTEREKTARATGDK